MFVYLVKYEEEYEVNEVLGVFDDYEKVKDFVEKCKVKYNIEVENGYGWIGVYKVEVNKEYDGFGDIGEKI